ncbi:hypothetical protein CDAR_564091 [Caerostris darwini]|uniref:Uncharacterized protein n=1 Tax=Caerostris darwini TaxID=1538125 RepID=A0AAV4M5I3_9ARAC|nr:hypothetical protein CDAR_564091 [Caerostris darwini]
MKSLVLQDGLRACVGSRCRPQEEKYEIDTSLARCTNEMISSHLNSQSSAFAEEAPLRGSKQRSVTSLPLGNDALERGMNVTSGWSIQKNAPS